MTVTASLIRAILDTLPADHDVPAALAVRLEGLAALRATLDKIRADERAMDVRHAREREEITHRLASTRRDCPHHVTTYHGDPSGGGDGHRECDLCGAELYPGGASE